jgi:hypothetical protein
LHKKQAFTRFRYAAALAFHPASISFPNAAKSNCNYISLSFAFQNKSSPNPIWRRLPLQPKIFSSEPRQAPPSKAKITVSFAPSLFLSRHAAFFSTPHLFSPPYDWRTAFRIPARFVQKPIRKSCS